MNNFFDLYGSKMKVNFINDSFFKKEGYLLSYIILIYSKDNDR